MSNYKAPLTDMRFVMFDLLKLDQQYARIEGGANAIMTCWSRSSERRGARIRPTVSLELPAANGTTMVIGRLGQFCASAGVVNTSRRASDPTVAAPFAFRPKEGTVDFSIRLLSMPILPAGMFGLKG